MQIARASQSVPVARAAQPAPPAAPPKEQVDTFDPDDPRLKAREDRQFVGVTILAGTVMGALGGLSPNLAVAGGVISGVGVTCAAYKSSEPGISTSEVGLGALAGVGFGTLIGGTGLLARLGGDPLLRMAPALGLPVAATLAGAGIGAGVAGLSLLMNR